LLLLFPVSESLLLLFIIIYNGIPKVIKVDVLRKKKTRYQSQGEIWSLITCEQSAVIILDWATTQLLTRLFLIALAEL
jgi:hypothetical protein